MQVRDKWIIAILVLLMVLTGLTYYGLCMHNNETVTTTTAQPTQIVVNGNGSSGTGDVQNVQQVTQVQQVSGEGTTKTVYVDQEVTGTNYVPKGNTSG